MLDNDVFKSAGGGIYDAAREMHAKRMATLDNPKGIAQIMDYDPRAPMNRATSYEKIPGTITKLSKAQYDHVLETLRNVPPELRPQAQAALAEIKSQWANKIKDVGEGRTPGSQWNAPAVDKFFRDNAAKIGNTFADQPEVLAQLKDLREAGNILRVDASYPGAAAQASSAVKRGVMSNVLRPLGASVGASVGGAVAGPAGAAAGGWAGDLAGARAASSVGERSALKKWQKGITPIKEFPQ